MHFRVSTRRKGETTYLYGQLVESYRRDDGMPAHRVLVSLGRLTQQEADNLRLAFKANKRGQAVVVADAVRQAAGHNKCAGNYPYLAVAAFLKLWREWGLDELIHQLLPQGNHTVAVSDVIAALVLHRCVDPGSKLAAVNWFAESALPELMAVKTRQFHNSRIHRALDLLSSIEGPLQDQLSRRVLDGCDGLQVLFLDCTDTWFFGRGPAMASLRRTKEGMLKQRVGIALLCNAEGFPLRWATVDGDHDERVTMMEMVRMVTRLPWAQQVPIVMDRGMGSASTVCSLSLSGARFITAVPVMELPAYSDDIPLGAFEGLAAADEQLDAKPHLQRLAQRAEELGLKRTDSGRHRLDLGLVQRSGTDLQLQADDAMSRAQAALVLAEQGQVEVERGGGTWAALGERWQVEPRQIRRWRSLLELGDRIRDRVRAGDADGVNLRDLADIAAQDPGAQAEALEAAIEAAGPEACLKPGTALRRVMGTRPLQVRAVVVFRPELYVRKRLAAQRRMAALREATDSLNEKLRSPRSRRTQSSALGELGALARANKLASFVRFEATTVDHDGRDCLQIHLTVNEEAWLRRRGADGLNLVVAHPDTLASADEIVGMYFDKDKVEKDFRTIKSAFELRPVYHRTDFKVQAHVTLCVLALLLERTLEKRLRHAGLQRSSRAACATLATCYLNRFETKADPFYSATQPTQDQLRLLDKLGMSELVDDAQIAEAITPR